MVFKIYLLINQHLVSTLDLKEDNGIGYIFAWISKRLFKSNLKHIFNPLSPRIKRFGYKAGMQFLHESLVVENRNHLTNIGNVYIIYDLDSWSENSLNIFSSKKLLAWCT